MKENDPFLSDSVTPSPGAYLVGTILGVKKITTKDGGKTMRFLRLDDGQDSHEMFIPDSEIEDYPSTAVGEVRIVPVRLGTREYRGVTQLSLTVRSSSK